MSWGRSLANSSPDVCAAALVTARVGCLRTRLFLTRLFLSTAWLLPWGLYNKLGFKSYVYFCVNNKSNRIKHKKGSWLVKHE